MNIALAVIVPDVILPGFINVPRVIKLGIRHIFGHYVSCERSP